MRRGAPQRLAGSALLSAFLAISVMAQGSASVDQRLTIEVKSVVGMTVSGDPRPLVIENGTAGTNLLSVTDQSTSYSIVTNIENMKIAASIDNAVPEGTQLLLTLASARGTSHGPVEITRAQVPVEVVSAIGRGADRDQEIRYTFIADASVGEIPRQSRVVTLTLTD
jgi:hypothetical protein